MNTDAETKFLYAVAQRITGITLANALGLLEDAQRFLVPPVVFDWQAATLDERAAEARKNEKVMGFLPDRKIQAIKEIRTVSGLGLKEAKDIADKIQPPAYATTPAPIRTTTSPCCGRDEAFGHYTWCYNYHTSTQFDDEPPF